MRDLRSLIQAGAHSAGIPGGSAERAFAKKPKPLPGTVSSGTATFIEGVKRIQRAP